MTGLHYFLLENDRQSGELVVSEYTDKTEAASALHEKETNRAPEVEVVLFMARSLDDLKRTHSRFFKSLGEMVKDLQIAATADTTGSD